MMTETEIYKHALENLRSIAMRQQEMALRYPNKAPEWRSKYSTTRAKIQWLEKLLKVWEVK